MRYLGNKTKLLNNIEQLLKDKNIYEDGLVFCDLFSGTGTVGEYFKDKYSIIANDSLYFSHAIANGKLKYNDDYFKTLGFDPFEYFNKVDTDKYTNGFCYKTFSPAFSGRQYFSDENAKMIDFIRDTIDRWKDEGKITDDERLYLIGCLIESVSKVANVAGVYGAYLKTWDPRATKRMKFIPLEISKETKYANNVYWGDACDTIAKIKGDILYLDPPYTSQQYVSQYHVLETIAKNDKPEIHGKCGSRDNSKQISKWCKKGAVHEEFEKLIEKADFKYIILSYSDDGIMSKEYIEKTLKRYAKKDTYFFKKIDFQKYKNTRTDNKEDKTHYEWLFFIEKEDKSNIVYSSPLNYIGGKGELIPFIKENLPEDIDTFYDLFGGGCNVSININANKVVYNDLNWIVKDLLKKLSEDDFAKTYNYIERTIKKYNLKKNDKETYVAFRNKYNSSKKRNLLDLYLLICYGFQQQIRFNSNLEFNNPCGNSSYNQEMLEKLVSFSAEVKRKNIEFCTKSYKEFKDDIKPGDFVYLDPPYLITCGAYNDGKRGFNGWDDEQEKELLEFLNELNSKNVKFMLSNVIEHNGKTNTILKDWIKKNDFKVIEYDGKIKSGRKEVIVVNY